MGSYENMRRNIVHNLSRWETADLPTWSLYVEVTYRCNARCYFCQRWKDGRAMDRKMFENILGQAEGSVVNVVITGGEPLIYPGLIEILRKFKMKSYNIHICTNGIRLPQMAKEIHEVTDHVNVSIDSNIPEVHDRIRGTNGAFAKAIEGIRKLKMLGTYVRILSMMTNENIDHIDSLFEFSNKELGCENVTQLPQYAYLSGLFPLKRIYFNEEEVKEKSQSLIELAKKYMEVSWLREVYYKLAMHFLIDPKRLAWMKCTAAGKDMLFINPDGNVYPCDTRRDVCLGNLNYISLKEIQRKEVPKFRKRLKREKCVCFGGCAAENMIRYQFRPLGDYGYGIPIKLLWRLKLAKLNGGKKEKK